MTGRTFLVGLLESEEAHLEGALTALIDKALEPFQRGPDFDARLGEVMAIPSADTAPPA